MAVAFYRVAQDLPGSLFIMPCPPADGLDTAVRAFADAGIETVVSMLSAQDVADLGLQAEAEACAAVGLEFLTHPIVDFGLPDPAVFDPFVVELAARLARGETVAVHCRAGIGRSGMAVASALIALGWSLEQAVALVSDARGVSIPDTVEQGNFIADFGMRVQGLSD